MIRIDSEYYLDEYRLDDKARLAQAISDEEIAKNTLAIPYPYTLDDAEWWLNEMGIRSSAEHAPKNWCIRNDEGLVCGGIGLQLKYGSKSHKDEFGYWLMRDLWGQGIMTKVVKRFSEHCFNELGLIRLEAPIFAFNKGSARVLEKSGFVREGHLRKAYRKKGVYFDSFLYAKVCP